MLRKPLNLILIILAIIILLAVDFTIYSKYKPRTFLENLSHISFVEYLEKVRGKFATYRVDQIEDKNMEKIVRQPAVAGAFYPASKSEVEKMINSFLAKVPVQKAEGQPRILIVPHAGYVYSGSIAAYSFKRLENLGYKRAIVIGPSHHFPATGLVLSGATHWQTPLGLVKVADINSDLAKEENFTINDRVHEPEHSLEVEVPFLQIVTPDIEIIPIIVGQLNASQQSDFVEVLDQYLDAQTVLIVSVDLSHYHKYDEAVELDNQSIEHILNLDSQEILNDEIDASWAVAAVLELAKKNDWQPKLFKYANSGDTSGYKSEGVVGYAAIGFYGENKETKKQGNNQDEYTQAEKQKLLEVARDTIEMYLKEGKTYEPETDNPKFKEERGVFVTLNKNHNLRGCIGYIEPIKPLIEAVRDNAISAAAHDNRFPPVQSAELDDIEIEVSILTVPKPDTIENIIKHKKGVVLSQGSRGATYLPQVWEDLSDPIQFFSSLCQKGGLLPGCYKDSKTEVLSYEAIVFHE